MTASGSLGLEIRPFRAIDREVEFVDREAWQAVEQEWLPVEITQEMRSEKSRQTVLLSDAEPTEPADTWIDIVERRTFEVGKAAVFNYSGKAEVEIRAVSDNDNRSTFFIMSDQVARDGAAVDPDGVEVGPYLRNPVVLWQHGHDPQRGNLPIARTVALIKRTIAGIKGWLAMVE